MCTEISSHIVENIYENFLNDFIGKSMSASPPKVWPKKIVVNNFSYT